MNIISVTDITKTYTERKLFEKASFYLQEREKVGVIGINGTGKSTLLKIAAGIEEPDEGQVIRANHIVVRYLPQNPVFDPELSVIDTVLAQSSQNFVGGTSEQNQNAGNHAEHVEHWNLESDAKAMMTKLGITNFEQKAGELSGGQRKRLALVAALLVPCDVLILDEPTNHLDSAMADWLEDFLKKWRGALIMVTHDRYFLDSVCNRIVEVDKGSIYSYDANYSGYLELKAEREEMQQASERKRQNILRKELEWIRRGAKARTTKQKGRIQRYEKLKDQDAPQTDGSVEISSISSRMGKTTVELSHISKSYDSRVLIRDFTYIFLKNDRIGFVDIRTLTILEDYLDNYDGIVITVSHDRYFLDRVVNRIFAFEEDGKICQYEGGYTDYVNRLAEEGKVPAGHILDAKNDTTTSVDSVEKENQTSSMDTWKRERKLKFSYKEQKEYETIEDDIAALEQKIEELDAQTLKFSSDFVKLNENTKEKEQTEQLLEEKMERWEYLEDLAAKIAGQQ